MLGFHAECTVYNWWMTFFTLSVYGFWGRSRFALESLYTSRFLSMCSKTLTACWIPVSREINDNTNKQTALIQTKQEVNNKVQENSYQKTQAFLAQMRHQVRFHNQSDFLDMLCCLFPVRFPSNHLNLLGIQIHLSH